MTHTPGPWYLDDVLYVVRPGPLPCCGYPDEKIAAIYGWTPDFETLACSNGNLIAAAPDLLNAVEKALAFIHEALPLSVEIPDSIAAIVVNELQSASAKARGQGK